MHIPNANLRFRGILHGAKLPLLSLCNRPIFHLPSSIFQQARYPLFIACLDLDLPALYLSHFRRKRITLSIEAGVFSRQATRMKSAADGRQHTLRGQTMEGDLTERLHSPCFKWGGGGPAQSVFCTIFLGGMCLLWEGCSSLCLFQAQRGNGEGVWEANDT